MKPALLRSSLIGFIAMIIIALVVGAYALSEPRHESFFNSIYLAWFPIAMAAPIGLPVLVVLVALTTWRQIGKLSIDINTKDAKKQLMISVWISTVIATLPFLLLTLILLVLTLVTPPTHPGDSAGLGMGMFFSMLCLFYNIFLVFVIGLLARLLVKKDETEHPTVI